MGGEDASAPCRSSERWREPRGAYGGADEEKREQDVCLMGGRGNPTEQNCHGRREAK